MISTKATRTAAAAFATSLFLVSCSNGGNGTTSEPSSPAAEPETTAGDATPATTDADKEGSVVATTTVWADVASAVLGEEVPAVISNPSTDPHEFEPSAADLATATQALLLVANGGAYDHAIYSAADPDRVISALPLSDHGHDHDHDHAEGEDHDDGEENEHIWYDTNSVRKVANELAGAAESNGQNADTSKVDERLDAIDKKIAELPSARVAQTEPIGDAIVANSALEDVTPEDYRRATLNETEPSSSAVAELITKIENGEVDLLIYNPQTETSLTDRIVDAAKEHNIPIAEIAETPQGGVDFFDYFDKVADDLNTALASMK